MFWVYLARVIFPPEDIGDSLLGHSKVEDVAVIGVPDDYSGKIPKAFMVPKRGQEGSKDLEHELVGYVKDRKVTHQWITAGIKYLPSIPKSASDKILRRVLRHQAKKEWKTSKVKAEVNEKAKS